MTNFKVNEIAWYTGEDFNFAPCYCIIVNTNDVITDTQEEEGHYLFMPLIANHVLHVDPEFEGWCAWPHQLRKVTLQLQPEYLADQPHIEPDEVAHEENSNLSALNSLFGKLSDIFNPDTPNYPSCAGVDCDDCPFYLNAGCGVIAIKDTLDKAQGID